MELGLGAVCQQFVNWQHLSCEGVKKNFHQVQLVYFLIHGNGLFFCLSCSLTGVMIKTIQQADAPSLGPGTAGFLGVCTLRGFVLSLCLKDKGTGRQ